jgi:hypothetical protein
VGYTKPDLVTFHKAHPEDESGFPWAHHCDHLPLLCLLDGDNLMTPFQCNLCIFWTLQGLNPGPQNQFLMQCIWQASLDAIWGRETATVSAICTPFGKPFTY